jgi:hypothetical protein
MQERRSRRSTATARAVAGVAIAGAVLAAALLAGCGLIPSAGAGASIIPGPSVPPGTTLDAGDLRLRLVDRLGPRWYCDPDEYPIAVADEQTRAIERFPEVQAEGVVYGAVLRSLGLADRTDFTPAEKLAIYRAWKVAVSIPFDPVGDGAYRFDYTAQPVGDGSQGTHTTGTISAIGAITIETQDPAEAPNCPICLARGSSIETPNGPVAVEALAIGDAVWTLDAAGRRIPGTVIAIGSTIAPRDHHVVHVVLADGRSVTASPGHPLADGRRLGTLRLGDAVDGSRVVALTWLPYGGGETFDLVASGPTGAYLAGGIPLGTTLR